MLVMDTLPEDVLINIFNRFLDGFSIFCCKRVCVRWQGLINYLEESPVFWKKIMLREAGVEHVKEMTEITKSINWKSLYSKWYKTYYLLRYATLPSECDYNKFLDGEITALHLSQTKSGVIIILGYRNGCCRVWQNSSCIQSYSFPGGQVTFVNLVQFSETCKYVITATSNDVIAFRVHEEQPDNSNPMPIYKIHKIFDAHFEIVSLRVFGHRLMILSIHCQIIVLDLSINSTQNLIFNIHSIPSERGNTKRVIVDGTRWATIWDNKIICIKKDLIKMVVDIESGKMENFDTQNWNSISEPSEICVAPRVYLFRNGITALITYKHLMLSPDAESYRCYNTLKPLGCNVTAIHIFGRMVLLGTNTGRLVIYTIKRDEELLNISLERYSYNYKLTSSAIAHIGAAFKNENEVVLNVVATNSKVFELCWKKP